MTGLGRNVDESTIRMIDGVVGFWILLWLIVAAYTSVTIWELSSLGDTISQSGRAIGTAANALQRLGELPIIGDGPRDLGNEAQVTAQQITADGAVVTSRLRRLSVLLGLALFFIPVTPLLGLWLPLRLRRRRDVRMIARALAQHEGEALDRYLAGRAVDSLPFPTVRSAFESPEGSLDPTQVRTLADAELQRLGLRRPARSASL